METIFAKKDYIERENKKIKAAMAAVFRTCSTPNFYCAEEYGVWGIWLDVDDVKYLVDPIDLVDSIFRDAGYCYLESYPSTGSEERYHTVDVRIDDYCYSWRLPFDICKDARPLFYRFDEYAAKARTCVEMLHEAMLAGKSIAYKMSDFEIEAIRIAVAQLGLDATMPSYYRLVTSSVRKELFVFNPVSNTDTEHYTIGIGDRCFTTWLTHWDNDYDKIRFQFESFVHNREATVELSFDMSDTVVKIKRVSVLDEIKDSGAGYGFKYKDFALVEIQPNEFVHGPIIKGYCDMKDMVRTFYFGLLKLAWAHRSEIDDEPCQIEAYNMFKSPVIERFLSDAEYSYKKAELRQVWVKRILRINPDYDEVIIDSEGHHIEAETEDGNIEELYDMDGNPIKLPGLVEWQNEITHVVLEAAVGREAPFDWADYHRRGLELARQLREKLSPDFDLWYSAPFENKSGTIPEFMLIMSNQ